MRLAFVEGRFYDALSDALLEGAVAALKESLPSATYEVFTVLGAFEIPALIGMLERSRPEMYDGFVSLGIVIRGQTSHYDVVVDQTSRKLMDLSVDRTLCMGFGLVTVDNEAQAWARVRKDEIDVGGRAVRACLSLIDHRRKISGGAL